jgi:hypothetical protein
MEKMKKRKDDQNQIERISTRETEIKITAEKIQREMTMNISNGEDENDNDIQNQQ